MADKLALLCNYSAIRSYAYDNKKICDHWISQVLKDETPLEMDGIFEQITIFRFEFDKLFSMCEVKCEELKSEIYEDVGE